MERGNRKLSAQLIVNAIKELRLPVVSVSTKEVENEKA
jgi:hypothetical protein